MKTKINEEARRKIGARIKELRAEAKISQRDLAQMTGFNPSNIARIELGQYDVGISVLEEIAEKLGCEVRIEKKD